jgi:hypothetical protein
MRKIISFIFVAIEQGPGRPNYSERISALARPGRRGATGQSPQI